MSNAAGPNRRIRLNMGIIKSENSLRRCRKINLLEMKQNGRENHIVRQVANRFLGE
jgi:hypothetical protein